MDWQIVVTFLVLAGVICSLTFLRAGADTILMGGLTILIVTGIVPVGKAVEGFSNEGLLAVAFLFVVSEGIRQTGGFSFAGQQMLGRPKSLTDAQARVMVPSAVLSAFLNNTPVVAMMMPVISDWAKKMRISISHLMLPLSYAAILGGLCTLVGTSTTLVVDGLLQKQTGRPGLSMFEVAWIGVPVMVIGLIYLLVCSRWLLPERKPAITPMDDPREYTVEMVVEPGCPLIGKTIEQAGLRHLPGMYLMEIDRADDVIAAVSSNERLAANDQLVFVGVVESVIDLQKIPGLKPATDQLFKLSGPRSERCLIEAVVSDSFRFLNMSIRTAKFRSNYNAAVIAVARNGQRINKKIGDIELQRGDTLLIEAHPSFIDQQRNSREFFLVSQVEDSTPPRHERAWIARLILLAMIGMVALFNIPMLVAAMVAAGLMTATRCCSATEAKRSIDWGVLITIAAGLGIGQAIYSSGAAKLIANAFTGMANDSPLIVLAILSFITLILTNLITAKATATLIFPITVATANALGVDLMPFVITIIISAAACFATPIGYQTNLMVFGPGGYKYGDYLRIGGPLTLIVWLLTVIIVPLVWPFHP
ncbi:Sodium-dependent dicarboxylate transporter SdcS [Gimesia panareensis]|uniref:Sodium-dependent dicarboxylate transporter SdcS n=1 Tax=Gimesia panareensis TaxID=2527978 RepID=A0A518FHY8_9PLAN|nr:SLC13 family permease [Gimesia panareensis]QDV15870.1 Sodium-dependent dicarboxylate transporter SdcS [Gimesia panareensis]